MVSCAVLNCKSTHRSKKMHRCHRRRDSSVLGVWLRAIGKEHLFGSDKAIELLKKLFICDRHFSEKQKLKINSRHQPNLIYNAIPDKDLPFNEQDIQQITTKTEVLQSIDTLKPQHTNINEGISNTALISTLQINADKKFPGFNEPQISKVIHLIHHTVPEVICNIQNTAENVSSCATSQQFVKNEGSIADRDHWSVSFFRDAGIPELDAVNYALVFQTEDIETNELQDLNEGHLEKLGIKKMGHRLRILRYIKKLEIEEKRKKLLSNENNSIQPKKAPPPRKFLIRILAAELGGKSLKMQIKLMNRIKKKKQ